MNRRPALDVALRVRVPSEMADWLEAEAARRLCSVSAVVREAVQRAMCFPPVPLWPGTIDESTIRLMIDSGQMRPCIGSVSPHDAGGEGGDDEPER